ncbi:ribosome maturation factor RimM [Phytoactinopolyspora mesophila]|uniref:Ribosome maturation factor RimM n=1 Tax=Phytoactinopolyspora mesophila TaxID=2650750 RepID=A0A7K3M7T7_9ACTN|nr:ribosome maturation factor RimM [Phytoactinopolyspora mesophila]
MIVTVGVIGRAHGVRGEVTVDVRTDVPDERFAAGAVLQTSAPRSGPRLERSLIVRKVRWHQGRLLVEFDGITDRSEAETLRGLSLQVEIDDDVTPDDPDEYFDHQLLGLRVVTPDGTDVGEVSHVRHGPGQDMLTVTTPDGAQVLVPFVAQIVPEVDVDAGRVVVDPPPGLLDLGTSPGASS